MRLLITNDDGIESKGIHALARALAETEHDVFVVAPATDQSGVGASIGRILGDTQIPVERVELPDCDVPAWSLAGPPGLCVIAARLEAFGDPPDLVVSGINAGLNTGRSVLHSGTVGAALTAQNFGASGLAVSIRTPRDASGRPDYDGNWHWETAARFAVEVLPFLISAPARSVLNLNVPSKRYDEVLGVRWAGLAPFGAVRTAVSAGSAVTGGDAGHLEFELRQTDYEPEPHTDQGAVQAGWASLTTLVGVVEAWPDADESGTDASSLAGTLVPGAPLDAVHQIPDPSAPHTLRRPTPGPEHPTASERDDE